MTDITNAAKKGRSGQTSSEIGLSILNWIELSVSWQKYSKFKWCSSWYEAIKDRCIH